jgi:hypothetical protein
MFAAFIRCSFHGDNALLCTFLSNMDFLCWHELLFPTDVYHCSEHDDESTAISDRRRWHETFFSRVSNPVLPPKITLKKQVCTDGVTALGLPLIRQWLNDFQLLYTSYRPKCHEVVCRWPQHVYCRLMTVSYPLHHVSPGLSRDFPGCWDPLTSLVTIVTLMSCSGKCYQVA